ncbi:MAG: energy transducer TonB [Nibricoccus sp.]
MVLFIVIALFAAGYGYCQEKMPQPWPPEATPDPTVQQPVLTQRVEPVYPPQALSENLEDEIYVAFVVNAKGEVVKARAFFSQHEIFEEPALEAVRKWKFSPALMRGRPISTRMVVPIAFRLPKKAG